MMIDLQSKNCLDSFFSGSPDGRINVSFCESASFGHESVPATTEALQATVYNHKLGTGTVAIPDTIGGDASLLTENPHQGLDLNAEGPESEDIQPQRKPVIRPFSN